MKSRVRKQAPRHLRQVQYYKRKSRMQRKIAFEVRRRYVDDGNRAGFFAPEFDHGTQFLGRGTFCV